jgi:hypothetical protein
MEHRVNGVWRRITVYCEKGETSEKGETRKNIIV